MINLLLTIALLSQPSITTRSNLVGKAVDIASSAYQFRADVKPDANAPESWLALMHFAGLPLNHPVDQNSPAIKRVMNGLLWEEIRPVQTVELTWPENAKRMPHPGDLALSAMMNQGGSSSWWNNLRSITLDAKPTVSADGRTYSYAVNLNTCGLVVSAANDHTAAEYDVPQVRVLTPDTWKEMDVEVEWGFDSATQGKDYSGKLTTYDGRVSELQPLSDNNQTMVSGGDAWRSIGKSSSRRGIKLNLLYQGISKWRKQQQYTTQPEDVARTIVTVWTKAGNFSFLAADLEHGPILAPEYGFFVRRTSELSPESASRREVPATMTTQMNAVVGSSVIKGWGTDDTPIFAANPSDHDVSSMGITFPANSVAMHPGQFVDVLTEWRSPISGKVDLRGSLTHYQRGGHGVEFWVVKDTAAKREILDHGTTAGDNSVSVQNSRLGSIEVEPGDRLSLIIGPKGDYHACTTTDELTISELGGDRRVWNLTHDVAGNVLAANPHPDSYGNAGVWRFASEMPMTSGGFPSEPPIDLADRATSAKEFESDLKQKGLSTIREQTRLHPEQTWEAAVTETRGPNLPPIPAPPVGSSPEMEVSVPSERMTAQWNLGKWHLVRHCATNPVTGKLWFNDYPYGILGAETYMVLHVLDLMGSPAAAAAGFDQWTMLPLDRNPPGTDPAKAIPEHPVGLFADGHGALTNAVGPDGAGGQMDVIHAFGPGSIGWALTQHYWLSGDTAWLKANAARIEANAHWMLRQRHVAEDMVPGGNRLWCKGLQPALQVTPDSGGLWMQFYECEGYYWSSVAQLARTIAVIDPVRGAKLKADAEAYRKDLRAAVERSIALSPVVPVRDGTYHSVVPFACYCRGLSTGAWGWERDGSGSHVGPLYWDTVQSAAALVSPAHLLPADDVRVQGYLDVLEDRVLLENKNVGSRNWFFAGWQYQGGLERTANMHLAADDIPVFIRSFLNCYAVDILPNDGYVFNEHAVHGPPDKIFEEAAFLERFRNLLVMEDGANLWLARGTPREWLEQGKKISVRHAPTQFGAVDYELVSDVDNGKISATIMLPSRNYVGDVLVRVRHPKALPIVSVMVNGKPWKDFDVAKEVVRLHGLSGTASVVVRY